MSRVSRVVSRLGVTVVSVANPAALRPLFERFRVVTLITHFELVGVAPDDILDPRGLLELISHPQDDVQHELRAWCERYDPNLLLRDDHSSLGGQALDHLAKAIDSIVEAAHVYYRRYSTWNPRDVCTVAPGLPSPFRRLTRVAFEESLGPTLIKEAPAVEFREGLFTVRAVVDAVPEHFSGVIDLALCNSAVLGGAIRRQRKSPRALVGRWLVDAAIPWSLYKLVIEELAANPAPYINTTVKIREVVAEIFSSGDV